MVQQTLKYTAMMLRHTVIPTRHSSRGEGQVSNVHASQSIQLETHYTMRPTALMDEESLRESLKRASVSRNGALLTNHPVSRAK
jgi:hypothetical protein